MDGKDADLAICQACLSPSERRCSECGVCQFCSDACEEEADRRCHARIACAHHRTHKHEDVNIGSGATHLVMMEMSPLSAVPASHKQTQWQTLMYGATQYLRFLLASSSQIVCKKTAFGMSVVVTQDDRFSAGRQRLLYVSGKQSDAAAMVVRNMADLALTQLKATHAPDAPPRGHDNKKKKKAHGSLRNDKHHDYAGDVSNQACIVSGLVVKEGIHFDAIFLIRKNDMWTIHGIQPLWLQELTFVSHNRYKMAFQMQGYPPSHSRHSISLLERALNPAPPPVPAPAPAPAPTPAPEWPEEVPSLSSEASEPEPPPLQLPPALAEQLFLPPDDGEEQEERASLLRRLPSHLAKALQEAEASAEAPPWTKQLEGVFQWVDPDSAPPPPS